MYFTYKIDGFNINIKRKINCILVLKILKYSLQ